jgi:hypothetical protein
VKPCEGMCFVVSLRMLDSIWVKGPGGGGCV